MINIHLFIHSLYRANENGEYESIPGSIELLPLEIESTQPNPSEVPPQDNGADEDDNNVNDNRTLKIFVKQEYLNEESILPDITSNAEDSNDQLQVNEDEPITTYDKQSNNVAGIRTSKHHSLFGKVIVRHHFLLALN